MGAALAGTATSIGGRLLTRQGPHPTPKPRRPRDKPPPSMCKHAHKHTHLAERADCIAFSVTAVLRACGTGTDGWGCTRMRPAAAAIGGGSGGGGSSSSSSSGSGRFSARAAIGSLCVWVGGGEGGGEGGGVRLGVVNNVCGAWGWVCVVGLGAKSCVYPPAPPPAECPSTVCNPPALLHHVPCCVDVCVVTRTGAGKPQ